MRPLLLVATLLVAGCAGNAPPAGDAGDAPAGPARFEVAPVERAAFVMSDGVSLDAAIWRPAGAERSPVILHAMPYASVCTLTAPEAPYPKPCAPDITDPFWLDEYNGLPRALVEAGYAYVDVSVRGTGASGGCFSYLGPREREDLGEVLDQLAEAEWAGEVGMLGLSYMSITPFEAIEARPGRVKVAVVGGVGFDEYTFAYTPQGASSLDTQGFWGAWFSSVQSPPLASPRGVAAYRERACPGTALLFATHPLSHALDERDRDFYLERRWLDQLRGLDAGVLVVQGLHDRGGGQQVEFLWPALDGTPRGLVLGPWDHRFPDDAMLDGSGLGWPSLPLAWFDHFLRGAPPPPALGRVHVQVEGRGWESHDAWPPASGTRALYVGEALTDAPTQGTVTFRAKPEAAACDADPDAWRVAMTEPLDAPVTLVGNPMAWLEVELSSPSGTVAVDVWDVPGDDVCEAALVSYGAADLRFRDDPFRGTDVPVGTTLGTRIDLHATAWVVPVGHRIALTLSTAGEHGATGRPGAGAVTVRGASHVLLPTTDEVGAPAPGLQYPPRPMGPDWSPRVSQ